MNVAVIGDSDMAVGFRLAGVSAAYEAKPQNAAQVLDEALGRNFEVIIITEKLAALLKERMADLQERVKPVIVEVPDKEGPTGYAQGMIRDMIKRAVGVDISAKKS